MKSAYKQNDCCGEPNTITSLQLVPMNAHKSEIANPCNGTKPKPGSGYDNKDCFKGIAAGAMEQSGINVIMGMWADWNPNRRGPPWNNISRKPNAQSTYSGILARSIDTWANMTSTEKALMIMSTRSTILALVVWLSRLGAVLMPPLRRKQSQIYLRVQMTRLRGYDGE